MSMLQEGQKVLIIRYGKKIDCIEKHSEVIGKKGYCWFGKIGVIPSTKAIAAVQKEDSPAIILYSRGTGYIATFDGISYEKPEDGFPEYYKKELFDQFIFPKSYFKLTSLERLSSEDMEKLKIVSSGNDVIVTLNRSMASFFFAEYGRSKAVVAEKPKQTSKKTKKKESDKNDCVYKKDGMCGRKGFVNFKYECERPSSCMGQKC